MLNKQMLLSKMVAKGLTQQKLSKMLGIGANTLNRKINGHAPLDLAEADKLCEILDIQPEEKADIFFWRHCC